MTRKVYNNKCNDRDFFELVFIDFDWKSAQTALSMVLLCGEIDEQHKNGLIDDSVFGP